jgi:hypothetical protein
LTVVLALVGIAFVVGGIVLLRPFRPQPPPTPTYYGRDWSAPPPAVPYTGASWSSDRLRRAGWTLVGCGGALVAMLAPLATVMPQAPDLPSVRAEIVELDPAATGGGVSGDEMVADYAVPGEAVPRTVRVAVPDAYAYRVGDAIEVFYDPDDPSKVSGEPEAPHSGWWAVAVAVVAVAIAAGTAGWLVLIRARSRAAAGG